MLSLWIVSCSLLGSRLGYAALCVSPFRIRWRGEGKGGRGGKELEGGMARPKALVHNLHMIKTVWNAFL